MSVRTIPLGALLIAAMLSAKTPGQVPGCFIGPEIFITMESDSVSPWTCDWIDFRMRALDGTAEFIDLTTVIPFNPAVSGYANIPPIGYGTHGPLFALGSYLFEPFWWSQSFGNLGGILAVTYHSEPLPGVCCPQVFGPMPHIEIHGFAPQQRQGLRIARADGQPFYFDGLDYRSASTNFAFGQQLSSYADFASFTQVPTTLMNPAFTTLTIAYPIPLEKIRLAAAPGAAVVFNPGAGTFNAAAVVTSIEWSDGMVVDDPLVDRLVGGSVTVIGSYTGVDLAGLSDVVFTSATLSVATSGGVQHLDFSGSGTVAPTQWRLVGLTGAFPELHRPLLFAGSMPLTTGTPLSVAITSLGCQLLVNQPTLVFSIAAGLPRLAFVDLNFQPSMSGATRHAITTSGTGDLQIGIIDMLPNGVLRHFVAPSPQGALGTGPFFGLEVSSDLFLQFAIPPCTHPFHQVADANGVYFWGLPPGALPPAVTADFVLLEMRSTGIVSHAPVRVVF